MSPGLETTCSAYCYCHHNENNQQGRRGDLLQQSLIVWGFNTEGTMMQQLSNNSPFLPFLCSGIKWLYSGPSDCHGESSWKSFSNYLYLKYRKKIKKASGSLNTFTIHLHVPLLPPEIISKIIMLKTEKCERKIKPQKHYILIDVLTQRVMIYWKGTYFVNFFIFWM